MHDFRKDPSWTTTVEILDSLPDVPPYVTAASLEKLAGADFTRFADATDRVYPCDAKVATWLSAAYLYRNADDREPVEQRLLEAADFFKIAADVDKLRQHYSDMRKSAAVALPDEQYALVWESEAGTERAHPLRDAEEIKSAAAWLEERKDDFLLVDQKTIATKILKQADACQTQLDDRAAIERLACLGWTTQDRVAEAFRKRATIVGRDPEVRETLYKLADTVERLPLTAFAGYIADAAQALDSIDQEHGLCAKYARELERPTDVCFELTPSQEQQFKDEHFILPTGECFRKSAVATLTSEDLCDWFGPEKAAALSSGFFASCEALVKFAKDADYSTSKRIAGMLQEKEPAVGVADTNRGLLVEPQVTAKLAEAYGPVF